MKAVVHLAWERLIVVSGIIGDAQARVIAFVFYFTVLAPFGLASRLLSDPLRINRKALHRQNQSHWLEREPVSSDLESARQQG